jgi:hypothetical protein
LILMLWCMMNGYLYMNWKQHKLLGKIHEPKSDGLRP